MLFFDLEHVSNRILHISQLIFLLSILNICSALTLRILVFPSGAVELNEKRFLRLEDFYNKTNSIPQVHLERLILDVSMIQPDEADPEEFYKSCAKNLKKTAPNLKKVALEGGYQYYPSQPVIIFFASFTF